jgi:hypothetical protein
MDVTEIQQEAEIEKNKRIKEAEIFSIKNTYKFFYRQINLKNMSKGQA